MSGKPNGEPDLRQVGAARERARDFARAKGIPAVLTDALVHVASECVTNALKYGGGCSRWI